ncbi:VWA domain-containing protein [Streptomyces sp. NPDC048219]|uniref:VWA domain-containing protein n=1 Tax=Streptomyces sp. NPDC048219 TaxID=3365517 RepID=UPI00370FA7C7
MQRTWGIRRTGRGRARRAAVVVLGGTAVLVSLLTPAGRDPVPVADSAPAFPSVNYAVAVDESASLAPEDMKAEKAAAARIALGDVSSSSHVTVFGFAAAESAGQRAVDPVCPRTTLDAAGRKTIGACVDRLSAREKSEGTGTDFPTAIRQGVHDLTTGTDPSEPRVLFVLTDGKMDVTDSEKYGDPAHRAAEGERQLTKELANARAQNVQIWPLGFGDEPDKEQLDRMAAGGYRKGCVNLPSAGPKAQKVSGAGDVGTALEKIFAAAHCLRHEEGPSKKPPATLEIGISPLATVGSIVVDKGDPEVRITYLDPSGQEVPTSGDRRGSHFELAGGDGPVEALKITDPLPGTWRVKAEAPEGHRSLPVAVSVLWQGELGGAITMDPPSPRPGEKVTVTMRLHTREGYQIKDPEDYAGLRVSSELTGDGFPAQAVSLADDGKGADPKADDGSFSGTVTIPQGADGALKVDGTLTASGLRADTRSELGEIAPGELPVTTALELPDGDTHPGGSVTGTLTVRNNSEERHTLRLSVADVRPELLSVGPAEIQLAPGESGTRKVKITVAPANVFGDRLGDDGLRLSGTVTVADAGDDDRTLVRTPLSVQVTPEPGFWEKYWWAVVAGAAVLVLAAVAVLAWMRQRRARRDPHGLVLRLVSADGEAVGTDHVAGHGHKQWYEFSLAEPHRAPRIERRTHGEYAVQRNPEGGAVLRRRGGGRTPLPVRGQVSLNDTVSLALGEETRGPRNRRPSASARGGAATGAGAGPASGSRSGAASGERDGTGGAYDSYM